MLSPIGAEPPVNGPDKPILIGSSGAEKTFVQNSIATSNITRPREPEKAAVTVYPPPLFLAGRF
jgi:hypothetical protein